MNAQNNHQEINKRTLDKQLEKIGWGLFIAMIGILLLLPEGTLHEDTWLIGMGAIIFGTNGIRYLNGIKVQGFWTVIGIIALTFGVSGVYGLDLPVFQVLIIIFGISILLKPWKEFDNFNCCNMMNRMWDGKPAENENNGDII